MKSDRGAGLLDGAAVAESAQPGAGRAAAAKALQLVALVLATLLYLAAASLLAILLVRVGADLHAGIDPLLDEARRPPLAPSQLAARELAVDVLRQILLAALVVGVAAARDRSGWRRTLALGRPAKARTSMRRLWILLLIWPLVHIAWMSTTAEMFRTSLGQGVSLSPALSPLAVLVWLTYIVVLAPAAEELLLRGEIFARASSFLRPASVITTTAGVFVLAHLPPEFGLAHPVSLATVTLALARPISLLPLALALGWLRWRTGRLWPCVALHAWSNLATLAYVLGPG